MSSNIGNVTEVLKETSFRWKINTFQQYLEEEGREYTSPVFSVFDACWRLRIRKKEFNDYIEVFLRREDWGPPKNVLVKLWHSTVNSLRGHFHNHRTYEFSKINEDAKYRIKLDTLDSNEDSLIINCYMTINQEDISVVSLFDRLWNLSLALRKIRAAGKGSDVVLKVKDSEIPAHRMILESRSSVFERMFNSEMEESRTGIVRVNDMEEDVLKIVLSYLYSGETEGIIPENVVEVYKAAHKYDLQDLCRLCSTFLKSSLTVDCLCDAIMLADLYKEDSLMDYAKEFFVKNSSAIRKTEKWKSFKSENSALCVELLDYMMEEK